MTTDQIIQTTEFKNFYKLAIEFCDFIENYPNNSLLEFLKTTRQNLLKLYDTALRLQWVELQSNVEYEDKLENKEFENILLHIADETDISNPDSKQHLNLYDKALKVYIYLNERDLTYSFERQSKIERIESILF